MVSVPVLMYHGVAPNKTVTPELFEEQVRYLAKKGYRPILVTDLVEFMRGNRKYTGKMVCLTFDDGFVDNWVYVFPVLKKYGFKATTFAVTSRVMDSPSCRPNTDDVREGRNRREDLPVIDEEWKVHLSSVLNYDGIAGSINWEEMRRMEKSGLVDIQSHGHLHASYFANGKLTGFRDSRKLWWLGWATDGDTRPGIPVYAHKSSLVSRRYFADRGLLDYLADYTVRNYQDSSSRDSCKRDSRKIGSFRELVRVVREYDQRSEIKGECEDGKVQRQRILDDLKRSKALIEEKVDKRCNILCWPWGHFTFKSLELAKEAGYTGTVTCRWGSNSAGDNPFVIHRFSVRNRGMRWFSRKLTTNSSKFLANLRAILKSLELR
jgi:peptidoglycan/xylan/chitin deacetylase (PgdA/CDA1 family)